MERRCQPLPADDNPARGKIGPGDDFHQFVDRHVRVIEHRATRIDDFAEVVRRNIGCHADGDTARTVYQDIRELSRQNLWFTRRFVIVRLEINRVFLDIVE